MDKCKRGYTWKDGHDEIYFRFSYWGNISHARRCQNLGQERLARSFLAAQRNALLQHLHAKQSTSEEMRAVLCWKLDPYLLGSTPSMKYYKYILFMNHVYDLDCLFPLIPSAPMKFPTFCKIKQWVQYCAQNGQNLNCSNKAIWFS